MIIEKIVYDYLKSDNTFTIPFYMMRPEEVDTPYYIIEKTGSQAKAGHLVLSTIAIQSYADTLYDAAVMSETVRHMMADIIELDEVSKCTCTGEYNFTNTSTKQPRYQATFELCHFDE